MTRLIFMRDEKNQKKKTRGNKNPYYMDYVFNSQEKPRKMSDRAKDQKLEMPNRENWMH